MISESASKFVLFTGAGFSKNWGGLLATEVWRELFNDASVQKRPRLRDLLLREWAFEAALGEIENNAEFDEIDRMTFQGAIRGAFHVMESAYVAAFQTRLINNTLVRLYLLDRFGSDTRQSFVFTLNQDLLLERMFAGRFATSLQAISTPGVILPDLGQRGTGLPVMVPVDGLGPWQPGPLRNLIKLHGAFNWQTSEGKSVIAQGANKREKISGSALLTWYAKIFEEILCSGDILLMIIGYSFLDAHINEILIEAAQRPRGVKLFLWDVGDPKSTLDMVHNAAPKLVSSLIGIETRPLSQLAAHPNHAPELFRLSTRFFGTPPQ